MPAQVLQIQHSASDLRKLSRAFDIACRQLGIGLAGLDVQKRERLIKRAMKIAHANDQRAAGASLGGLDSCSLKN
jgi:hypothetical protein